MRSGSPSSGHHDSSSPPPPVSALRHKFEKLAHHKRSDEHLNASESHHFHLHPKRRANSNEEAEMQPALRLATSSSDLKNAKRPPPPPPGRPRLKSPVPTSYNAQNILPSPSSSTSHLLPATFGAHAESSSHDARPPSVSPLLRPVPVPSSSAPTINTNGLPLLNGRHSPLLRKPPPPPPPSRTDMEPSEDGVLSSGFPTGGVASLRSKFSGLSNSSAPSLPSNRQKSNTNRIASHSSAFTKTPNSISAQNGSSSHAYRHSLPTSPPPMILSESPDPLIDLSTPLTNGDLDPSSSRSPPPLPSRSPQHFKEPSTENTETFPTSPPHSRASSENEYTLNAPPPIRSPRPSPTTRPHVHVPPPPPRPPPRGHSSAASSSSGHSSGSGSELTPENGTPTLQLPPPLPVRRSPTNSTSDLRRPHTSNGRLSTGTPDFDPSSSLHSLSPTADRKVIGSGRVAPPPTRSIQKGEKLPPARQEYSSSESVEEEEPKGTYMSQYTLPDASHSSRRLPTLRQEGFTKFSAHVSAHVGVVAAAGNIVVVAAHHSVKIYDLSISDAIVRRVELHELGLEMRTKEPRVTCMEFRSTAKHEDRGCLLWMGTKDGHLLELDVRTGDTTALKPAAHSYPVTHIFRFGQKMITLDENGKLLIFSPDANGETRLDTSTPRLVRVGDKQGFARMMGGMLWMSAGSSSGHAHSNGSQSSGSTGNSKGPTVRVYDVLSTATNCPFKSLTTNEPLGPVTSGTTLATQLDKVYLGHEGGFVSVWSIKGEEGYPVCIEVVKVSVSDVLCLEGINDRLWAGGRKGYITAHDVTQTPWVITNSWLAHEGSPVYTLNADPFSIEKCHQFAVYSFGRDEKLRFWDGLLGLEWIENKLMKQDKQFSTFRDIKVLIVTWNVDASKPDTLVGCAENVNFLDEVLHSVDSPDIIVFGFQELIDLENRKMAAKTVLLGNKKKTPDGSLSEKVSRSYKMWHDKLVLAVRLAMPPECPYTVVHAENLVGLFSLVFVKQSEKAGLKDTAITTIKRGMGGYYGNKGCVVARFVVDDSSICFINCHLAAGQRHVRSRNADISAVLDDKAVLPQSDSYLSPIAYVGGGDGTMVLDHDIVFLNGDMNYRIDQRRETVLATLEKGEISPLMIHDQLLKEIRHNRAFRLRTFIEPPISFFPTYKYDRGTSDYDTSSKGRIPAWCDRILYHCREPSRVECLHYKRYEANISDHRPVSAAFRATVKSIQHDVRAQVRLEIEKQWFEYEQELLHYVREFYVTQLSL